LRDIEFVGASGSPRVYHVFVTQRALPNATLVYDAQFDGTFVTITRSSPLLR
jgi:hypothetical protein